MRNGHRSWRTPTVQRGRPASSDSDGSRFTVTELVRRRAIILGAEGAGWLDELDATAAALARDWELTLGAVMHGGNEALVVEATTPDGQAPVLKIGLPGSESGRQEAQVLIAADGNGYARLLRHDPTRRAMLLERLGSRLDDLGLSVDDQIRAICETLKSAWLAEPGDAHFMDGAEKADSLARFVSETWLALERPCSERVVDRARAFAASRRAAFTPSACVLAHGDPHAWNTLVVPGPGPRRFKFVDPDGLRIEPAYDLAICMRGWTAPLLGGDTVALGRRRAGLLASLTGVDRQAIWEWGFIERVSTGLYLKQLGQDAEAAEFLTVAERWAAD